MTTSKKNVLIVDDDSRNIFALSAYLRSRGVPCLSATDAKDALHILDSDLPIAVVLMDMMMPGMDGYEAIPEIRKKNRSDLHIIAVTAQAMVGDREKCLLAGADAYIPKPVDIDILFPLLEQYIN